MLSFKKFFGFAFLVWLFSFVLKVFIFKWFSISDQNTEYWFWVLIFIISTALVRRLEHINFLEAGLTGVFWFISMLVLDFFITSKFLGVQMFFKWQLWMSYGLMMLTVFFMHKKRHIKVRKELAAKGHGH